MNKTQMNRTEGQFEIKDIVFLHIVLLVYTFGSIFAKNAAKYDFLSLGFCFFYAMMLLISVIYAFLWQKVLKRLPLIMAYANKAVTIIWGLIWGFVFFNESISVYNIIGAAIIVLGVALVVTGEEKS